MSEIIRNCKPGSEWAADDLGAFNRLKNPSNKYVLIASHRGDWRNAPENSLQSIINCIDMGLDLVEIDVCESKDGQLFIFHDRTLDRMTKMNGEINDLTSNIIKNIRLVDIHGNLTEHTIPSLEDALIEAKNNILVKLDKCYDYIPQAYKIVKNLGMINQVIFITDKNHEETKSDYGEIIDEILLMPAFNSSWKDIPRYVVDHINDGNPIAFEIGFDKENCESLDIFGKIKESNISIFIDSIFGYLCANHDDAKADIDPEGAWGWLINKGANIICTDRPKELLEYLKHRNLHD
jgi:glycerophosphoryl diester phosphodiesterase